MTTMGSGIAAYGGNPMPGTAPSRRVHHPGVRSGQLVDPGGNDPVERMHRRQQQVAGWYTQERANLPDGIPMDELADAKGIYATADPALQLYPHIAEVDDYVNAANERVAAHSKGVEIPEEQTGQASAIWNRAKDRVDKAKGVPAKVAAMQALIKGATGLTLQVYKSEFPFYAETEKLPGDWLPAAFAAETPGAADDIDAANLLQKRQAVGLANHQKIVKAMTGDSPIPPLLSPYDVDPAPYSDTNSVDVGSLARARSD